MPASRHTFARLNTDDDFSKKSTSDFGAALNISLESGYIAVITGNVLVPYDLPALGTNVRLGGFEDGSTGTIVSLLYNSRGAHRLIRYDPAANSETTLLEWVGLNLSDALVPHGGILDGLLLFLDAAGEVRCVNLKRAANGEYTPAVLLEDPYALHLVKQPPKLGPTVAFERDSTRQTGNLVGGRTWQFAIRYRCQDGEVTPLSPHSRTLYTPPYPGMTVASNNQIRITLSEAPTALVKTVEVLFRGEYEEIWLLGAEIRRDDMGVFPPDALFFGYATGGALTAAEATKIAEAIPVSANAMTLARSRAHLGGCREGRFETKPQLAVSVVGGDGPQTFHERSTYHFGIQFYDAQGRPGAVTGIQALTTPARTEKAAGFARFAYEQTSFGPLMLDDLARQPTVSHVQWTLPTTDPVALNAEIPAWATHYSIVTSKNQRCTFFLQTQAGDVLKQTGSLADGTPQLLPYDSSASGNLWVDIGGLPYSQMGYTFSPDNNDRMYFVAENAEARIMEQRGDYLLIENTVSPLSKTPHIEIYTPVLSDAGDSYFEEPGTTSLVVRTLDATGAELRSYGTVSGVLAGDSFIVQRTFANIFRPNPNSGDREYTPPKKKVFSLAAPQPDNQFAYKGWVEAMTPSVKNYETWINGSRNRPAFSIRGGNRVYDRLNLIRFSGVKVQGTQINGLCQWEALSQYDEIPQEQGAITRLTVADQTSTDGTIILVNQERGDVSLSLGQSQIRTADDQPLLAITKSVIGGSNALRGGYGCADPGSVAAYAGKVFWFCGRREEVLRYDRNGITPLALTYKARTRIAAATRAYRGGQVRGAYDPRRQEYHLQFIGKAHAYDGMTLVYSDRHEAWADEISLHPEAAMGIGNELISWKDGATWRHTTSAPQATFFGLFRAPQLTFTLAQPAGMAKQFKDVAIESRTLWLPTFASTDTALTTQMLAPWFIQREGVYRAGFRRAGNSPGFATLYHALDNGVPLIGTRLTITLTAPENAQPLTAISVSFAPRSGQNMSA